MCPVPLEAGPDFEEHADAKPKEANGEKPNAAVEDEEPQVAKDEEPQPAAAFGSTDRKGSAATAATSTEGPAAA